MHPARPLVSSRRDVQHLGPARLSGIAVGVFLFTALFVLFIWLWRRLRLQKRTKELKEEAAASDIEAQMITVHHNTRPAADVINFRDLNGPTHPIHESAGEPQV
ncbi:hypothetical protein F4778DRAFT_787382 [Xylariomycetidae sp. FL2044]|nr:hypothetical protein F4778DRAFT_787382 [Xylariomycetidae sp. FL2044]